MELKMMLSGLLLVLAAFAIIDASVPTVHHPNVIIMHVNKLLWNDLGIHVNKKDNENSTPNIDRLAYSGTILNRFYANGGVESLLSGCYLRSQYGNSNLMTSYFERNGYNVNFILRHNFDKIEAFEKGVLDAITNDNKPFLAVADFGVLGHDIKIPFIDDIVGSVVTKTHNLGVMNNTIMLFLSLPDNNESPLEINIRRTAFVYSPLLKLQQRVSNQIIHVIDLLPTLVNATNLKWRTRDRIYIDGINQWQALNANDDERLSVYGDNFYISNYWKLTFGANDGDESYGSIDNEDMEADKDNAQYDFETYVKSISSSEVHQIVDKLSSEHIMSSRSRAMVHCNLKDVDESAVKSIRCSRSKPCLFDLLEDPCEFDNKQEREFDYRRQRMAEQFERYLRGEKVDEVSDKSTNESSQTTEDDDGPMTGIILGSLVFIVIFIFIVVVCVKEKCNRKRSVYHDKAKQRELKRNLKLAGNGSASNGSTNKAQENGISVITHI